MPEVKESLEEMDKRYEELFKKIDSKSSGKIDISDLTTQLKDLGVCPQSLSQHAKVFFIKFVFLSKPMR